MKKRVLSLLIAMAMIVSMIPFGTFAAYFGGNDEKDKLVYVSIGDSMTNGYGNDGYDGSSGIVNYANNTYANLFAAWLAGCTGEIADDQVIFEGANGIVDHRQLAMSGMRAEDIHWLLELDHSDAELIEKVVRSYQDEWNNVPSWTGEIKEKWFGEFGFKTGDYRTRADLADANFRLADGAAKILAIYHGALKEKGYFTSSYSTEDMVAFAIAGLERDAYYPESYQDRVVEMGFYKYLQISAEFYQESVADADVISLALGNTNFGTYMLNEIMDVVMNNDDSFAKNYDINDVYALADLDPAVEAEVKKLVDKYDDIIDELFGSLANGDETKLERLKYIITYCVTSFAVNYIGTVDAILEMNPDVKIIQVALMNAYADEASGIEGVTLGDMVDIMYTPVNAFIAALPTAMQLTGNDLYEDATFYYAEADSVSCMVDVFGDDFYKENGQYVKYPGMLNGTEGYEANLNSTVRDRFFEEIFRGQTFDMMVGAGIISNADRNGVTLADVVAYDQMLPAQKAAYAAQNSGKAKAIALYLSFENAHIRAGKGTVTMESLAALDQLSTSTFASAMAELAAKAPEAGKAYTDDVLAMMAASVENALESTINGNLQSYGVSIDITVTGEEIGMVVAGVDGAAKAIADKAVDAMIKEIAPIYVATVSDMICTGIEQFLTGIEGVILSQTGLQVDLTLEGYVNSFKDVGQWTGSTEQKMILAELVALDGASANGPFIGYLVSHVAEALIPLGIPDSYIATYATQFISGVYNAAKTDMDNAIHMATILQSEAAVAAAAEAYVDNMFGVNTRAYVTNMIATNSALSAENVSLLCYLLCMPQVLSDAMVNDSTLSGILCMNARCLVGTGIGGHPSEAGHFSLYEAVQKAYKDEYTSQDKTLQTLYEILKVYGPVYGPKIVQNIWNQWVEAGYVGDVEATIHSLKTLVSERYTYYTQTALPALRDELKELAETKDALNAELEILKVQLAQKKAELEEVIAKQEIGSVTAPDLDIDVELGEHVGTPENDCNVQGKTSKEELEAAIADLEHAIAVLEALISDIDTDINTLIALGEELAEAIEALGNTLGQIVAAGQDIMEAFAAIKDVMTNESAFETAEQFMKTFEAARATALAAADLLNTATKNAGLLISDINTLANILITDSEALYNKIVADLPLVIENAPMEVKMVLAAVMMMAEEKGITLENAKQIINTKLDEIKMQYAPKLAAAEQALENLMQEMETEIATRYAAVEAQLKAEAAITIEALMAKKAALEAELKGHIETLKNLPANAAQAVRDQLQAQIDRITGDLAIVDADIAHAAEHLEKALKLAYAEIVADVNAKYEAAVEELKKEIADLKTELEAAIGKSLDELLAMGTEGIVQILERLKDILLTKGEEAIVALTDKLVALFNEMLHYATHGEVLVGLNLKYVALGDGTNDYAKLLAEKMSGHAWNEMQFVDATKPGNTVAGVAANLPADVVGADVITLGFSQTEIVGRALAAYLAGESVDWRELVGEEAIPYVEKIMAYVNAEIDAMELDEKVSTILKHLTEAYAYGVVEYAINLPILIKNIREVNPTAEIVILGMYNPLENISINVQGIIEVDLSEYAGVFDYLIDGVYAYGVGLSVIARDVTYVDAREVEAEKSALGLKELDALLKGDISVLYPSAESDAYIADRIYNSLVFTVKGDANNDGKVDSYDAALIARYDIGLIGAEDLNLVVCDINGDGTVDSYDATLVARYDVGLLAA